ncbi:hypothetical protein ACHAXT_000730 [Thalassiosira profunda]
MAKDKDKKKHRKRKRAKSKDTTNQSRDGASDPKRHKHRPPPGPRPAQKPSLAQRLKKHRGVAAQTPPPPAWKDKIGGKPRAFLTPQDDGFEECLKTSFEGFRCDAPASLPSSLHVDFERSFGGMEDGVLFLYDVVQPGKKRLTRTSVTRTLVGDPGSTYKYLGLRLFSHPWCDVNDDGGATASNQSGTTLRRLGYSKNTATALITMGRVNKELTERSNALLQKHVSSNVTPEGLVGSAEFNLTLVNRMESTAAKRDLKKEAAYGMGKISVGWHRDSGLQDFSSIAVYQTLKESPSSKSKDAWGVALRAMDGGAGGPLASVPPLVVPLPSGSLYYMLDEFNHNHEHAVIAGSGGIRYSSTHRVAREGQGTYQYLRDKIRAFSAAAAEFDMSSGRAKDPTASILSSRKRREKLVSHVRAQQQLLTEVEFEWLRQWYVQGKKHAEKHPYWHRPIAFLRDSFCELEKATSDLMGQLKICSRNGPGESDVTVDVFDVLIEALSHRLDLRRSWKARYQDPIFDQIPVDERPFPCPCLDRTDRSERQLPEDLDALVAGVRQLRSAFVAAESGGVNDNTDATKGAKKAKSKKSKTGSLTKKEARRKASNWERLKANMKG